MCNNNRTGGPWTLQESTFHINYLELLAAFLAIKTFAKGQEDIQIDLQMDNMSALTYINKRGGTQSPSLTILAKECWTWYMDRRITLTAQHLPGKQNVIADEESRIIKDRWDWMLNPTIFDQIQSHLGPMDIDLFASRTTALLPH